MMNRLRRQEAKTINAWADDRTASFPVEIGAVIRERGEIRRAPGSRHTNGHDRRWTEKDPGVSGAHGDDGDVPSKGAVGRERT
ncbi:hypothetical protein VTJ04DRAFT_6837 [Mycothermus thermophilus]|uniref:uncharacterized protein n=1 Tax=Humicola insolens TaxID=85995 RepID=UPI0037431039